jgi:hypothetical protein
VREEKELDYAGRPTLVFFTTPDGPKDIDGLIELATKKERAGADLNSQDLVDLFYALISLGIEVGRD